MFPLDVHSTQDERTHVLGHSQTFNLRPRVPQERLRRVSLFSRCRMNTNACAVSPSMVRRLLASRLAPRRLSSDLFVRPMCTSGSSSYASSSSPSRANSAARSRPRSAAARASRGILAREGAKRPPWNAATRARDLAHALVEGVDAHPRARARVNRDMATRCDAGTGRDAERARDESNGRIKRTNERTWSAYTARARASVEKDG